MLNPWSNSGDPIGCDIGARHVRLAQVVDPFSSAPRLLVAERELPTIAEDVPEYVAAVADALRECRGAAPFRGSRVVSCLPARHLYYRTMRLAPMPADELPFAAHWKAAAELSLKPEAFKSAVLNFGSIRDGEKQKTEALVIGATVEQLERHVSCLSGAGLRPAAIDASICAIARCLGSALCGAEAASTQRRVVLELRDDTAMLAIIAGGDLAFARPVGAGLGHLDQLLGNLLEMTPDEARALQVAVAAAGRDAAKEGAPSPEDWKFPSLTVPRAAESIADASRMYGRELAREVALSMHHYATAFGTTAPESGTVVSDRVIDTAALEAVTVQSGIDFAAFSGGDRPAWIQAAAVALPGEGAGVWAAAVGLSMYQHEAAGQAKGAA